MTAVSVAAEGRSRLDVTLEGRAVGARGSPATRVAFIAIAALVLAAPFERLEPVLRLPAQSLSSVEAVLAAGCGLWAVALVWTNTTPPWRTPLTAPWLACLMVAALASVWSPASVMNALHMTSRHALAFVIVLLTLSAARGTRGRARVAQVMVGSAVVASLLVILEFMAVPAVLEFLRAFRPGVALAGTAIRAGGSFQYPTIASMYLEIALACALGLLVDAIDRRRLDAALLLGAAIALIGEGIVLTFTRSGLITALASLAIVALVRLRARGRGPALGALAIVAGIMAAEVGASRSTEMLRLRLTTEGLDAWFRASIAAPTALSFRTGERARVPIRVTNTGRVIWNAGPDDPVRLSYHWAHAADDRVVVWEGLRTDLPRAVAPGESLALDAAVQAPPSPGAYRLIWDIEQVNRLWFSTEPGAEVMSSRVEVRGPTVGALPPPRTPVLPMAGSRPGRFELWRAAERMVRAYPLLGVGPDNFRLEYGRFAGVRNADPRVHSNSLYVEVVAGAGLAGAAAFLWLAWRVWRVLARALRAGTPVAAGVVAAVVAVALHGLIDSFVSFTGVYVAIGVVMGLAVSAAEGGEPYAHRV